MTDLTEQIQNQKKIFFSFIELHFRKKKREEQTNWKYFFCCISLSKYRHMLFNPIENVERGKKETRFIIDDGSIDLVD